MVPAGGRRKLQEVEEGAAHLGNLSPLFSSHDPSPYLSAHQRVLLPPGLWGVSGRGAAEVLLFPQVQVYMCKATPPRRSSISEPRNESLHHI